MTIQHLHENIALGLQGRRNGLSQTVLEGDMRRKLGPAGFAEALRLRWLIPSSLSGQMEITTDQTALNRMKALAEAAAVPAAVGDTVLVAEGGESYQGVVSMVNPDGTYTVSFGTKKPPTVRPYKGNEVRRIAAAPGTPAVAPTGTPAPAVAPAVAVAPTVAR